jgi:hypothetical protein
MKTEVREMAQLIRSAYNKWNPTTYTVTGRYYDGAIREVAYHRFHEYYGFIVFIYVSGKEFPIRMHFPKFNSDLMAEWIVLMMEHYEVLDVEIKEFSRYDFRFEVNKEKIVDFMLENRRFYSWGYTFFEL